MYKASGRDHRAYVLNPCYSHNPQILPSVPDKITSCLGIIVLPKPKIWRKLIGHEKRVAFEKRLERAALWEIRKAKRAQTAFDKEREQERKTILDRIAKADSQRKHTNNQKLLAGQKRKANHSQPA